MVQLQILSGRQQGTIIPVAGFPFTIGRSGNDTLQLPEPGVWEQHAVIESGEVSDYDLRGRPNATLILNSEVVENASLKPGDLLVLGDVQLRFELVPAHQRSNRMRESFFWLLVLLAVGLEIGLIFWLKAS